MSKSNGLHKVYCDHGPARVLLAEVLDPAATVYARGRQTKGRQLHAHRPTVTGL